MAFHSEGSSSSSFSSSALNSSSRWKYRKSPFAIPSAARCRNQSWAKSSSSTASERNATSTKAGGHRRIAYDQVPILPHAAIPGAQRRNEPLQEQPSQQKRVGLLGPDVHTSVPFAVGLGVNAVLAWMLTKTSADRSLAMRGATISQ